MYRNNKLAKSVRLALMFGASTTAFAGAAVAQEQANEEAQAVERIQVTGSRLSRSDLEGATPVTVISRDDIDSSGFQSVADVLRASSFNVQGSFRESSGNASQGQATVSLRGLGSNRTLVLLNGRRMPSSPVLDGQTQNLNSIPFAAVERIEILSDGASAVYGADAIGGVINIILRSDFEGIEATASANISDESGGDERGFSIVGGVNGDRGNFTYVLEKDRRDIIFSRQREFFQGVDTNAEGENLYSGLTEPTTAARNIRRGGVYIPMADDCSVYGDAYWPNTYEFDNVPNGGDVCAYDYTRSAAQTAGLNRYSIFLDGEYNVTDDHALFARALYGRTESFGRYAPAAGAFVWQGPELAAQEIDFEGQTVTLANLLPGDQVWYRFDNTGEGRDTWQYDYLTDITVGAQGFLGTALNMEYEVSYNRSLYEMHEWGDGYVNQLGLAAAASDGWDPRHPDQGLFSEYVADMQENSNRRASMVTDRFDVGLNGEFDNGWMFYVGGELRRESYNDQTQFQAEAGNILGTSGGSSGGSREVRAVFGEISIPITMDLEVDAALRFDDYSDFGSAVSYKLAARYQPTRDLLIRASYGTGFRAPSLDQLFQAPSQGFAFGRDLPNCMGGNITDAQAALGADFADQLTTCLTQPQGQHETFFASNPDLDAEESEQFVIGAVWDATDLLGTNLSISADYYYTEITDSITSLGVGSVMWLEFLEIIDDFPGVEYNDPGAGVPHVANTINFQSFDTSGIDLNIDWHEDFNFGRLSAGFQLSYIIDYNQRFTPASAAQDYTKLTSNEYRFDLTLGWQMGNHSVTSHNYFIPSRCWGTTIDESSIADGTFQAECTSDSAGNDVSSFFHSSLQYAYELPWNARATVGVNNLFDRNPPLDANNSFNDSLYPYVGRQFLVRYTQRF